MNYLNESYADGYYAALCEMEENDSTISDDGALSNLIDKNAHSLAKGATIASTGVATIGGAKALKAHKEIKKLENLKKEKGELSYLEKKELKKLKRKRLINGAVSGLGVAGGIYSGVSAHKLKKKIKECNECYLEGYYDALYEMEEYYDYYSY